MRLYEVICLCLAAALYVTSQPAAASEPLQLGALFDLTGEASSYGVPSSQGAQLHADEINTAGGVLGQPIEIILKDSAGGIEGAASAAEGIIAEAPNVSALFGLSESDMARAAAKVAAAAGRVFVTSGATSPVLPDEVPEYLFLACFGDNVQAAAAAEFAYGTLNARSATILFDSSHTYTRLLQDYFAKSFQALGGEIVAAINFQGSDKFGNAAARAPASDIFFVAAESPPEALQYIKTLRESGFDQPVLGGDGYDGDSVWNGAPDLKDIYFTTHAYFGEDNPSPQAAEFLQAFAAAYEGATPDAFAGLGYDTVGLLAAAMEKAGSSDPDRLREALLTLNGYEGVTGEISFVEGSHVPQKSVTILQIADGKRIFVKEIIPTQIPQP
ncbi:MAG: ABC transporter substrate-binding protein [Pseudomonadota bacterium]